MIDDDLAFHVKHFMPAAHEIEQRWARTRSGPKRWETIRAAYSLHLPHILMDGASPYLLDWEFTPIEFLAWQDIRGRGLPLYPQFPALQYFIDFADPILQIGVELDGKAYHERERDTERDEELLSYGWRIFRVPGYQSLPSNQEPFDPEIEMDDDERRRAIAEWGGRWSEGFFWALQTFYYDNGREGHLDLAHRILDAHRYANFELELYDDLDR